MINLFIDSKALYQFMLCNRIIILPTIIKSRPRFFGYRISKTIGVLIVEAILLFAFLL